MTHVAGATIYSTVDFTPTRWANLTARADKEFGVGNHYVASVAYLGHRPFTDVISVRALDDYEKWVDYTCNGGDDWCKTDSWDAE